MADKDMIMIHVKAASNEDAVDKLQATMPGFAEGDTTLADPLPQGVMVEPVEDFMARGRAPDCDCGLIQCTCVTVRVHVMDCQLRRSMTCAVPIECDEHGLDVCPKCDPCTCKGMAP